MPRGSGMKNIQNEMINRVAKSIYESRNGNGCKPWRPLGAAHKAPYLSDAQAALEAMRNPTEHMINVGACHEDPSDYYASEFKLSIKDEGDLARETYKAMIGAAIKDYS